MTWLWACEDFDLRVTFARTNGPTDFFTLLVRWVVGQVTAVVGLALIPVDKILRLVGKGMIRLVLGMLLLLILTGIWFFLIWLPLMGTSRLWLNYYWSRPLLAVPGAFLAIVAHIFLMLVPDPQKNAKYTLMAREWPLSWHLYKPTEAYFEANPS